MKQSEPSFLLVQKKDTDKGRDALLESPKFLCAYLLITLPCRWLCPAEASLHETAHDGNDMFNRCSQQTNETVQRLSALE